MTTILCVHGDFTNIYLLEYNILGYIQPNPSACADENDILRLISAK